MHIFSIKKPFDIYFPEANVIFSVSKNVREYIKVRSLEYM
ncbi:hypothetical protein PFMALIP_01296 [Plasmodium falciparum MaliPS096_E11]|uniref:Uncharacterized protein n=1 Tax=Plasmodium falciparum MaliPS096_E11 TaxID=1036727 RepID=A0A024WUC7_PLAFA|nr:hypothetical protein PFMALIP_01296 [Plasmodium falciparum MaliPS096_E11]